jgi:ABC-type uncharacterized transport system involved in gliding motility auxiliary subunit
MTVAAWEALGKEDLPADADVVVVAGPRTAFLLPEAGALEKFVAGGGHALLLLDPVLPGAGAPPTDLGFGPLLAKYGIKLGDDIVVDPANALPLVGAETVLANRYGSHPIVRSLSAEGLPVILPLARSVTKAEKPPEGLSETMLLETSAEGWGETNLGLEQRGEERAGDARPGVAGRRLGRRTSEAPAAKAPRSVDRQPRFAANGSPGERANGVLFASAVHWLAGSEADRHRPEDSRTGVPVPHRLAGPADRPRLGRRASGPRDPARAVGLVPTPGLTGSRESCRRKSFSC